MNIPEKYKWVLERDPLPMLLQAGLKYYDLHEVVGKGSNATIMMWVKNLGLIEEFHDDDEAWCSVFMSELCFETQKPLPGKNYDLLRAKSFEKWGVESLEPMFCDVLVFERPGGNHVGLYIAESKTTYHVYGGNQSNRVGFTEIAKNRMTACRRFYHTAPPVTVRKYYMDSSGHMSTNES